MGYRANNLSQQEPSFVAAVQMFKDPKAQTRDDYSVSTRRDSISSRVGQVKVPKLSCEGWDSQSRLSGQFPSDPTLFFHIRTQGELPEP